MIVEYKALLKILDGTPLASLTKQQLQDAIIGEYPFIHSEKTLSNLWNRICGSEEIEITNLNLIQVESILSDFETLSLSKGNQATADKIRFVRTQLNALKVQNVISKAQAQIIRDQELVILDYELKLRELKSSNEALKQAT